MIFLVRTTTTDNTITTTKSIDNYRHVFAQGIKHKVVDILKVREKKTIAHAILSRRVYARTFLGLGFLLLLLTKLLNKLALFVRESILHRCRGKGRYLQEGRGFSVK